jgi:hypothetical protein
MCARLILLTLPEPEPQSVIDELNNRVISTQDKWMVKPWYHPWYGTTINMLFLYVRPRSPEKFIEDSDMFMERHNHVPISLWNRDFILSLFILGRNGVNICNMRELKDECYARIDYIKNMDNMKKSAHYSPLPWSIIDNLVNITDILNESCRELKISMKKMYKCFEKYKSIIDIKIIKKEKKWYKPSEYFVDIDPKEFLYKFKFFIGIIQHGPISVDKRFSLWQRIQRTLNNIDEITLDIPDNTILEETNNVINENIPLLRLRK